MVRTWKSEAPLEIVVFVAAVIGKQQESRIYPLLIFHDITKATQYLLACISCLSPDCPRATTLLLPKLTVVIS